MPRSPFILERLVSYPSILDDIAFYLAVDPFLGPPVNLSSLLLTCSTLHNHLSIANNSGLYARIFRYKFDCEAIERRLSARWTSAPCLARELRSRFIALQHIKHGSPSLLLDRDALWKAYLMLLENDGRNERQLFGWANLPDWILGVVALRSSPSVNKDWSLHTTYLRSRGHVFSHVAPLDDKQQRHAFSFIFLRFF
ncbi:hypothetical protein J3R83DRAFT_12421 [Lanmaoa asiatica]|nr:hypothetical protein J3R83DRAFT_12421 [Lanmaoa asiatica]